LNTNNPKSYYHLSLSLSFSLSLILPLSRARALIKQIIVLVTVKDELGD